MIARRSLTPLLLDHTAADTLVEIGGLRALMGDIPQWCKRPDHETVVWLNSALGQLWPHLSAALSTTVGNVVGRILGRISPLGMNLSFKEFNMGSEALTILSAKKVGDAKSSRDEVVLDLEVRWVGDPTVVLNVMLMGLPLLVRLSELQVTGTLRLCLTAFDNKLPCFHALKVSFVEQPDVRFALSLVGGDIDLIPGVSDAITDIIGRGLSKSLVWPKYVRVPIARKPGGIEGDAGERVMVSQSDAAAILEVTLISGERLPNMSLIGTSDPYVSMKLTNSQRPSVKSSVVVDDLNPMWNESFRIIVDDPSTQSLQLVVGDYSVLAEGKKMKRLEKMLEKCQALSCGYGRKLRKKFYNGVIRGGKLDKKETDGATHESGHLFQTVMGNGAVKLSELKPFEETERQVVLTKDALNVLTVFKKLGVLSKPQRQTKAGSLQLRLRLIPLSSDSRQQRANIASAGIEAEKALQAKKAQMGIQEPLPFMVKYAKSSVRDPSSSEASGGKSGTGGEMELSDVAGPDTLDLVKASKKGVEYLVGSVLGGSTDARITNENLTKLRPHLNGLLHAQLVKGESLVAKDVNGFSDPYFKFKLKTQKWTSKVKSATLNPVYNEHCEFIIQPADLITEAVNFKIECWDKDIVGKDFMGEAAVPLREIVKKSLLSDESSVYERIELEGVDSGAVHIQFRFQSVDISLATDACSFDALVRRTASLSLKVGSDGEKITSPRTFMSMLFGPPKGTKIAIAAHGLDGDGDASDEIEEDERNGKGEPSLESGEGIVVVASPGGGTPGESRPHLEVPSGLDSHALSSRAGVTPPLTTRVPST